MNIRPLIQQAGKPLYKGLFALSSDENIQGKSTAVTCTGCGLAWIFEEHRDSDRAKALEHELRAQAAMRIRTKILTQNEIYHG